MVNYDSTGFGGAEFAMPVPGVLVGKRLTLENLNERVVALEGVVQQLVEATYSVAENASVTNTTNYVVPLTEADELRARIAELEEELRDAENDREHWEREYDLANENYERLRSRLDDLLD